MVQLVVAGFVLGLVVRAMRAALLAGAEPALGQRLGTLNTARQTGRASGRAVFGAPIPHGGRLVAGLHIALVIAVALALLAAVLTGCIAAKARLRSNPFTRCSAGGRRAVPGCGRQSTTRPPPQPGGDVAGGRHGALAASRQLTARCHAAL